MNTNPDQIEFEQIKRHILRRIQARMRPYSLDEAYGIPGQSTWRGLLDATEDYRGSESVRSAMGRN